MRITKVIKGAIKYIVNPDYRFLFNAGLGRYNEMPDREFLAGYYKASFHRELNLESPQTYNEKLQWLKLYDHRPIYTTMVDKYKAKEYVAGVVGQEYVIPLLGVWSTPEEIDFSTLPDQFVLKCTHDCGGLVICKDKKSFDKEKAIAKLNAAMKKDYAGFLREWPYRNVERKIIAEPYLEDQATGELRDYKFFAFDGNVVIMFVASDRQKENEDTKFDFFDMDYNHLDIINGHPNSNPYPQKPINYDLMKELASKLSKGYPHVRVDFYEVNGKVYVGELTLYHWSGMVPFVPEEWDFKLGSYLQLPEEKTI